MAGEHRGWLSLIAVGGVVFIQDLACALGKGGATDPAVEDALQATVSQAAPLVIAPALDAAATELAALDAALATWEAAGGADSGRPAAQQAFQRAMAAWQRVELLELGPLGSSLNVVGGADLRERIYSWPVVNPCRVDQETATGGYATAHFMDVALDNVRGLDAIEHLLWAPTGENACPSQVDINAQGTWDALGADEIAARRAAYARVAVADAVATLDEARAAFAEGGDWAVALAQAGEAGPYESREAALNALYDAAFYIEAVAKDQKLAEPMGLRNCTTDCLGLVESAEPGSSHLHLRENLAAFRQLWVMGEGSGFDDLLRSLGQDALADEVEAALTAAEAAALALERPVDVAITSGDPAVTALYEALVELGRLWKEDVATALVMTVPAEAAGDND
ncbi:MAG: hypothetical protein JNM72_18345 [Deltaproteobacteria bacterium]|nr:hypothetical protein [Deltaproteobacteria bacterium]